MKKYLIIIFLVIVSYYNTYSQTDTRVSEKKDNPYVALKKYNGDTLGYVQHNFIDNKQKYIGKDLITLLKDVEIPIKSFIPTTSSSKRNIIPDRYLEFYTSIEVSRKMERLDKPVNIIIKWTPSLPKDSVYFLLKKNKGAWTKDELKYFGKQAIGDIMTTNWGN